MDQNPLARLKRGALSLVSDEELSKKLSSGRVLRVKLGVDPTSSDLHLGHSVVLTKLRQFQDLGHTAVLIIGDFTAMVGDPSGRDSTRPTLTAAEVKANAATYQEQAFKVLDKSKTELRFNSEWLAPFMRDSLLDTLKRHTVQQVLAREDFKKRIAENSPISLLEVMYPLMQGYDSVAVKADVELGGNDQLTNLLMGRKMQQDAGQEAQVALTVPLLVGLDGVKKMSKSYGNSIGLNDSPNDMFGKTMRVNDQLMLDYYTLLTDLDLVEVKAMHPMQAKKALARILVVKYHGEAAGNEALAYFENTFSKKEQPAIAEGDEKQSSQTVLSKIIAEVAGMSGSEARRLVEQGGVQIDGVKVTKDGPINDKKTFTMKVGKHKFYKISLLPSKT
jgi:tyrosyl-tRNA synthetase